MPSALLSDRVIVKVEDNGIGMSRESQEKIFTRFYQASASVEGSGVGLTICRRIVEDLGGSIGIASKGVGTGCVIGDAAAGLTGMSARRISRFMSFRSRQAGVVYWMPS